MRAAGVLAVAVLVMLSTGACTAPPDQGTATSSEARPPSEPAPSAAATPSASPTEPPDDGTLVMWTYGDLPPSVAEEAQELPGVTAAAYVRADTLGLVAAWRADGTPVDVLEDGFRIPVAVSAIDPAQYARTRDDRDAAELLDALGPGQVLLSETAAEMRGIGRGGSIELVTTSRLEVAAVVPDGTVGSAEIVLHAATADDAGMQRDGAVIVRHDTRGAATRQLRQALRDLAPGDDPARVVGSTQRITAPLVLSLAEVKRRFGEPAYRPREGVREVEMHPTFVAEHIVDADVPILGSVRCHEGIIDDLRAALGEIEDAGLGGTIDPAKYAGCYYPRRISTSGEGLSHHAWGIAIDINVDLSLPGGGPLPHPRVIRIFGRHGFRWGGDFLHEDNHHFEWLGPEATQRPPRD